MRNTDLTAYSMVVAEVLPKGLNGRVNESVEVEMRALAEAAGMRQSQRLLLEWSRVYLQASAIELPMPGLVPPEFNVSTPRTLIDRWLASQLKGRHAHISAHPAVRAAMRREQLERGNKGSTNSKGAVPALSTLQGGGHPVHPHTKRPY